MKSYSILLTFSLLLAASMLASAQPQLTLITCQQPSQDKSVCLTCNPNYHLF